MHKKIIKNCNVIILFVIFLTGLFFIYKNMSNLNKKNLVDQKINCQNYGRKNYDNVGLDGSIFISRDFIFSEKLNTCLMFTSMEDSSQNLSLLSITDILNNQTILDYSSNCLNANNFNEDKCISRSEFMKQKERIFK